MSAWALGMTIVFFALGLGIGIIVGYLIAPGGSRAREAENALEEAQRQLDAYQDSVGKHFVQTADLINQMTNSYRAVHQHLANGVQQLCPDQLANHPIELLEDGQRASADFIEGQQHELSPSETPPPVQEKPSVSGGRPEMNLNAEGAEQVKRSAGVAERA